MVRPIIIVGDSWGCGEWRAQGADYTVLHSGLEEYLRQDGHQVINLSQGGISNLDIYHRLKNHLLRFPDHCDTKIFVFQTDYTRDSKHAAMQCDFGVDDWNNIQSIHDFSSRWVERFYLRLSELSITYALQTFIIGGCSDTIWFDNMPEDYPGLNIACQSMTNLLVTGNSRITRPVFSWYTAQCEDLVKTVKIQIPPENLASLVDDLTHGASRESTLLEHPQWFYPDGKHPNRFGHKKLYDYLRHCQLFL